MGQKYCCAQESKWAQNLIIVFISEQGRGKFVYEKSYCTPFEITKTFWSQNFFNLKRYIHVMNSMWLYKLHICISVWFVIQENLFSFISLYCNVSYHFIFLLHISDSFCVQSSFNGKVRFCGMDKITAKLYCICVTDSCDYEDSGLLGCNVV
jgi:hypothetical protein